MDERTQQIATHEGSVPFTVLPIGKSCSTWYKVFGDLSSKTPPVIVLHGGPGAGHSYMLPFAELWLVHGTPVFFYDQVGCGSSSLLPETSGDQTVWQESLFTAELDNLLDHLRLREGGFHLLGHSWGGMVAAAFAATRPRGLRRLVLASPCASIELYVRGNEINREQLPADLQTAISEAIRTNDFDTTNYHKAFGAWLMKFLIGIEPMPPVLLAAGSQDPYIAKTMDGASPFVPGGSLEKWSLISRLPHINVPTFVYNAEDDACHSVAVTPFFELIPRVRWTTFMDASHMVHLQDCGRRERVLTLVGDFLSTS